MATSLNLFCLVDGQSTSNAFPINDIPSTSSVGDLKIRIKEAKPNDFQRLDADGLTLWKALIPKDRKKSAIVVDALEDKTVLDEPRRRLSELFPDSPNDETYIIVERPQASKRGREEDRDSSAVFSLIRSTMQQPPIQKFVPQSLTEEEMEKILKGVRHIHTTSTSTIDPRDVEASQREKLGRFYKRPLPYHETAADINLVMLGLELDKQARTSEGETLRAIVEKDIGKYSDHRVVAMVAPSGSGKTATVVDLASKHFVIYCVCCIPSPTISPGFKDPNFITLAKDVENIYETIINRDTGGSRDPVDIDSIVKLSVDTRVQIEFLARLLFLHLLLNNNPNLEPRQFFLEQTGKGASTIARLVNVVQDYHVRTIRAMLDEVQSKIRSVLLPRRLGVVIALDEAQGTNVLFDNKNQIQSEFRRGFLTPLSATLSNLQATLVILGTALSLQNVDHVYSTIAKQTNYSRITDFPRFNENDISRMLSDLVDMEDCAIPVAKRRKLKGRARFSIDVVNRLTKPSSPEDSKQVVLEKAIDKSIEHTMCGLRIGVRTILASDHAGGMSRLLSRMVLAYHLHGGQISFAGKDQSDFVDKAMCRLTRHLDGVHLVMDEPMVVEAVEMELKARGKDPSFLEYLDQIFQIVAYWSGV